MDLDTFDLLLAGGATAVTLIGIVLALRRAAQSSSRGDEISLTKWHGYALERGWRYHDAADGARMTGDIDGQPVTAAVRITTRRGRRGRTYQVAETSFRVPIRGRAPGGLLVRKKALANRVRGLFDSGRPIATGDDEIDEHLLVGGTDPLETALLIRKPAVKAALLALFRSCPEAVVHERAVEFETHNMVSNAQYLDLYMGLMTSVAAAFEGYIEPISMQGGFRTPAPVAEREPVVGAPRKPESEVDLPEDTAVTLIPDNYVPDLPPDDDDDEPDEPTDIDAPPPSSNPWLAEQRPPERLQQIHLALRTVATTRSVTQQQLKVQHLRMAPYRYELEVRSVVEGMSRLGIHNGKLQVNGVLSKARWRVELTVDMEYADVVLGLVTGDIIAGECLLEDLRGGSVVEMTARSAPELVEKSKVQLDS